MRTMLAVPSILILVTVATSFGGTSAAWSPVADVGLKDCVRAVGDEEHAQRLRAAVGLHDTADYVRDSFSDPAYDCELTGIPLTDDEAAAFLEVAYAQAELSLLVESVAAEPSFAGAWLEGDVLNIASTDGKVGRELASSKGSIELHFARVPLSELESVADALGRLTVDSALGAAVRDISYVAVDEPTNRVRVGVMGDVDKTRSVLEDFFGDVLSVYYAEPTGGTYLVCNVNDCGTKGGLAVDHDAPGVQCTSGFVGKSKTYTGSTYTYRMITAGHCIAGAGGPNNTQNWHNPADTKTWGLNKAADFVGYEYPDSCPTTSMICVYNDLGLFGLGQNPPTVKNEYFWSGSPGWIDIDERTTKSGQLTGQVVWRYGRVSQLDAGYITAKPAYVTQETCASGYVCRNYNAVEVDLTSQPGDSGSGFFRLLVGNLGDAFGVLSFGKPMAGYTYYYAWDQPFYAGLNFTDRRTVFPCISSGCPL